MESHVRHATSRRSRRPKARRGPAALTALLAGAAAASLAGAPAEASAPVAGRVPMHQCWVNGVSAPPGEVVSGTKGDDHIFCDSDLENVTVWGGDGNDMIEVGTIDFSGRVLGGSENDLIEAAALGPESGGLIQAGPGNDTISGPGGAVLTVGPHGGSVDAGVGKDTCTVKSVSTRTSISACETLPKAAPTDGAAKPAAPTGQVGAPTDPAAPAHEADEPAPAHAVGRPAPADTAAEPDFR
ncbi:hypothetical protein [Streptomyces sp. NPDC058664]|uniref:hypothetical protein n=1 Tax=unclassified Streptomyces TaxID=2593676 RepID=UPI003646F4BA